MIGRHAITIFILRYDSSILVTRRLVCEVEQFTEADINKDSSRHILVPFAWKLRIMTLPRTDRDQFCFLFGIIRKPNLLKLDYQKRMQTEVMIRSQ